MGGDGLIPVQCLGRWTRGCRPARSVRARGAPRRIGWGNGRIRGPQERAPGLHPAGGATTLAPARPEPDLDDGDHDRMAHIVLEGYTAQGREGRLRLGRTERGRGDRQPDRGPGPVRQGVGARARPQALRPVPHLQGDRRVHGLEDPGELRGSRLVKRGLTRPSVPGPRSFATVRPGSGSARRPPHERGPGGTGGLRRRHQALR